MKWIVYTAVIVNQVTRQAVQQVRRAPIVPGADATLAAEVLGGTLLSIQPDVRRAENLRRLTELQAVMAGHAVAEWTPPAEWRRETPLAFPVPRVAVSRRYRAASRATSAGPGRGQGETSRPVVSRTLVPQRRVQSRPAAVRPIAPATLFRPHPN